MLRKIRKFTRLSSEEKKLFLEAYVTLGVMRAAILTVSFKRLTRDLKHEKKTKKLVPLSAEQNTLAQAIGRCIEKASSATPWESACLAQSLTAQKMLKKRGIPGVFYLGAAKEAEAKDKMKAHAWSQCGDVIITGAAGHQAFTVLSSFHW